MCFSGHKLFAPTGIGVLYISKDSLNQMQNYQEGGGIIQHVGIDKTTYRKDQKRFEAGTPNISGAIALAEAIRYLQDISMPKIQNYLDELCLYAHKVLSEVKGIELVGKAKEKCPIISFKIDDIHSHDLSSWLNKDQIAVRAGHHCAEPLLKSKNLLGGVCRASMSIYNDKHDIDSLAQSLGEAQSFFWSV